MLWCKGIAIPAQLMEFADSREGPHAEVLWYLSSLFQGVDALCCFSLFFEASSVHREAATSL